MLFIFFVYACFACMDDYIPLLYLVLLGDQRRTSDPLNCSLDMWVLGLTMSPLEEHPVFLAISSTLPIFVFVCSFVLFSAGNISSWTLISVCDLIL